jgi:hypothetical protein
MSSAFGYEEVTMAVFGKPETVGVVLGEGEPPAPRRVHVTGWVTIEISVDEWIDAENDDTDADIKQAAIELARERPGSEYTNEHLDIEDETKRERQAQLQRERDRLAAWNRGEPIVGGS